MSYSYFLVFLQTIATPHIIQLLTLMLCQNQLSQLLKHLLYDHFFSFFKSLYNTEFLSTAPYSWNICPYLLQSFTKFSSNWYFPAQISWLSKPWKGIVACLFRFIFFLNKQTMGNVFSFSCLQSYSKYIHRLFHAVSHEIFRANFTKLCGFNNGVRCFLTRILLILFFHIFPMKLKAERLLDRQKIHIFQNHHTTYWSNKTSRRLMLLKRNFDPNPGTTNFGKILKRFDT